MLHLSDYIKDLEKNGKPFFTLRELQADLRLSKSAALSTVYRSKQQGDLMSPARGLYVIVPPEYQSFGSIPAQDLVPIIMEYHRVDYYVSLLSAAQYYGASHQKPGKFQVISNTRIKHPLRFQKIQIDVIYKKSLFLCPTRERVVSSGSLKMATPELVVFDLFKYRHHSGGLNHIATVLSELIESVSIGKLINLAKKMDEYASLQRLGYMLEQLYIQQSFLTQDKIILRFIDKLHRYLEGKIHAFIPLASEISRSGFPRVKKWKIIANASIESDL